jgi:hypothetical protein
MKRTLVIIGLSIATAGCERSDRQETRNTSSQTTRSADPVARTDLPPPRTEPSLGAPSPGVPGSTVPGSVVPGSALEDRQNTSGRDEHAATDTGKNERDRAGDTKTPGDQGESEADRGITQRIRQAVVADDALSSQAKNAKIITANGVVTLRGPVESNQEKTQLASLASRVQGVTKVDNQLEVSGK